MQDIALSPAIFFNRRGREGSAPAAWAGTKYEDGAGPAGLRVVLQCKLNTFCWLENWGPRRRPARILSCRLLKSNLCTKYSRKPCSKILPCTSGGVSWNGLHPL